MTQNVYTVYYLRNVRSGMDIIAHKKHLKYLFGFFDRAGQKDFERGAKLITDNKDMVMDVYVEDIPDNIPASTANYYLETRLKEDYSEIIFVAFINMPKLIKR